MLHTLVGYSFSCIWSHQQLICRTDSTSHVIIHNIIRKVIFVRSGRNTITHIITHLFYFSDWWDWWRITHISAWKVADRDSVHRRIIQSLNSRFEIICAFAGNWSRDFTIETIWAEWKYYYFCYCRRYYNS